MISFVLAGAIATYGFGILFQTEIKYLHWSALCGGIGCLVYYILTINHISSVVAMFFAALSFSILAEFFARVLKTPPTMFSICALIPLVPGKGMYDSMVASLNGNYETMAIVFNETLLKSGALALGIVFSTSIGVLLFRKRQKIKKQIGV